MHGLFKRPKAGQVSVSDGRTLAANDLPKITYAGIQNVSAPSLLLGRGSSGAGSPQEISLGSNLSMSGTTLNVSLGAAPVYWGKITNDTVIGVTTTTSLTVNRLHEVQAGSSDYTMTLPASPTAGDVVGVMVRGGLTGQFKLDAGVGVSICGRTRYLVLLHTNVALIYWNGSAWLPLVLCLDTPWLDAGAITITAVTTNPTKGTTSRDKVFWRRSGKDIVLRYVYHQTAAGTAGSGDYLYALPIGSIDTTFQEVNAAAWAFTDAARYMAATCQGLVNDNGSTYEVLAVPYDSTKFRVATWSLAGAGGNAQSSATYALSNTVIRIQINLTLPMTDW